MNKRTLRRQLSLAQVVMLGTAGAIGAQIFVLTGHAAGIVGPGFVLALIIGGLLSYSIALNYCELASTFPETGGAMTYVREAWGRNLLSYLIGSMDCLSSTFYAALSAVGFAYSLQIFFPALPIVPTAIAIILVFVILNVLGVSKVGNVQTLLGMFLLLVFTGYIIIGFAHPNGFQWSNFLPDGRFLIHERFGANVSALLNAIALAYVAFIGFEVIADDAEEIKNPDRNIPAGILISLTLLIVMYPLIAMVTLGTIPWTELAGSEVALTDAVRRFFPTYGPPLLAATGIVATITSLNTALLSATREAFTLSRDGMWPRFLSRLSRFRTPYAAILVIGAIVCAVAAIGLVEFLSYISSSGYLFVLFFSNLALIRIRQRYPGLRRPFKTPFYPWIVYAAMGTCFFIVAFSETRALLFGLALLSALTLAYYVLPVANRIYRTRVRSAELMKDRILVPVANPKTGARLVRLASILAQTIEGTSICIFHVTPPTGDHFPLPPQTVQHPPLNHANLLPPALAREIRRRNVPHYTKTRAAPSIARGILEEIGARQDVKLVLAGWPGPLDGRVAIENPVKTLLEKAQTNVLVLLDHGHEKIRSLLVPIGGGPHSRLALRLAYEIAEQENARVTALHTYTDGADAEEIQDQLLHLREIIIDELGTIPARIDTRVTQADSVIQGILEELERQPYNLLVMGASEEWGSGTRLFGSVDDWIIEHVEQCSVLLVRHYEPVALHWLRRQIKTLQKEY